MPNQRLAVHRWFRYSAGFSGRWAAQVVRERASPEATVLDPFAGVATTLLAAESEGRRALGIEAHPFVARVAEAKLAWRSDPDELESAGGAVIDRARRTDPPGSEQDEASLLAKVYTPASLVDLRRLQRALDAVEIPSAGVRRLLWLALVSILRDCSGAGTAPWQYVLPRKRKASVAVPFERFARQVRSMAEDMREVRSSVQAPPATVVRGDARRCAEVQDGSVDLVVTSPPYPNNYDYADATRLEQTFLGEVAGWADLHAVSRRFLVRACSQHAAAERLRLADLLPEAALQPIHGELAPVCERLAEVREARAGRKDYHTMVAAYFLDMAEVFRALGRVVRPGGRVCFVVGDSAPYGVYVPVVRWFGLLAGAVGFGPVDASEVRSRNTRWRNRKHRVPLAEYEMWWVRRRG